LWEFGWGTLGHGNRVNGPNEGPNTEHFIPLGADNLTVWEVAFRISKVRLQPLTKTVIVQHAGSHLLPQESRAVKKPITYWTRQEHDTRMPRGGCVAPPVSPFSEPLSVAKTAHFR
jgi:hypothetical protein